ncbi:hypothetical protein SS1G_03595 [Sclerotinia sclerotiorum 1980 UF-70]|uniref:Uncharacterized protein n=1 Tax=Sclerotinia sclerotiorum (strain ATCC 18683 / 1980 / Ss-1) TaxID=665079 RepID=A7EE55_SCLS1|nr:hypothetical protein SS1G_03595 [Sclerotinia sclerotiorum 1980 UF-70]EDO01121.1 hypothetical protein SS1G_03595 [Sclerotinia sclerotiorum 1980 UF-70]
MPSKKFREGPDPREFDLSLAENFDITENAYLRRVVIVSRDG